MDANLRGHDSRVLAVLVDHRNSETGLAWPSNTTIADILSSERSNVTRSIKRLVEHGYLNQQGTTTTKTPRGSVTTKCWEVLLPVSPVTRVTHDTCVKTTPKNVSPMTPNPSFNPSDKKRKDASLDFEVDIDLCAFGESLGFTPNDLQQERTKALDYWKAYPEKAPTGCPIAAFKGWLRFNKPKKAEAETTSEPLKGKEALVADDVPEHLAKAWIKVFNTLSEATGGLAFKMDLSKATLTNGPKGSLNLEAESKFILSRILSKHAEALNKAWAEEKTGNTINFIETERKAAA